MNDTARLKYLRIALVLVGIVFIVGIYLLMIVWPSGWTWHTGHSDYPLMIVGSVRHSRRIPAVGGSQSARSPEPYLVHRLV